MVKSHLKIELYNTDSGFSSYGASHLNIEGKISVIEGYFSRDVDDPTFMNLKTEYNLTAGDKFYFLPGVSVPRIKLKDLASSHKIKTVRDINDATVIFTGKKTAISVSDDCWMHSVTKTGLLTFLAYAKENNNITDYEYEKLVPVISSSTEEVICTDYKTARLLWDTNIPYHLDEEVQGSDKFTILKPDYYELYNNLKTKELYSEDALYPHLNGPDANVIDEGMYESISEMFRSSDDDNCTLAMEIMANCDYNQSIVYLGILFNNYGHKIYQMRSKNHVNFKSLLNYMGNTTNSPSMNQDEIVRCILNKNLLTVDHMNVLSKEFANNVTQSGNSRYFRVKTICFSKEVDEALGLELTMQVKNDYVHESVQEVEEEEEDNKSEEPIQEDEYTNTEFDPFEF